MSSAFPSFLHGAVLFRFCLFHFFLKRMSWAVTTRRVPSIWQHPWRSYLHFRLAFFFWHRLYGLMHIGVGGGCLYFGCPRPGENSAPASSLRNFTYIHRHGKALRDQQIPICIWSLRTDVDSGTLDFAMVVALISKSSDSFDVTQASKILQLKFRIEFKNQGPMNSKILLTI